MLKVADVTADVRAERKCKAEGDTSLVWTMVGAGAGFLAGAGGISTLAVPEDAKPYTGTATLITGLVGAVSAVAIKYYGDIYTECVGTERSRQFDALLTQPDGLPD
jgi:hypothetical protein